MMKRRCLVLSARVLLAGTLLAAGWPKAHEPGAFIRDLWNFHLLPEMWAYWIAALLPYLEIVAGLSILTGLQRRGAHLLVGVLLPVFFFFHAAAWARGLNVACGCFGSTPSEGTPLHPAWWLGLIGVLGVALVVSIRAEPGQVEIRA